MSEMNEPLTQNREGEWAPAIPEPYYALFRKQCCGTYPNMKKNWCEKKFWTVEGYRAHYAYAHILKLNK